MTQTSGTSRSGVLAAELLLSARGIGKAYPGVRALDRVDLEVRAGEVHGVVGENGAGKSTLMGVISGTVRPDEGSVAIGGEDLPTGEPAASRSRGLAIVRQEPALLPDLTVAENLFLGTPAALRPGLNGLSDWASSILRLWSEDLLLDPQARVEELLPEQRFIVEICRAVAARPKVLILDEPTEHLAAEDVDRLFGHIRRAAAGGAAVVYISHRIGEVKRIADRITVLRNGRSQGTHEATDLTEGDIVNLIVGRVLEASFPPKHPGSTGTGIRLRVQDLSGPRFNRVSMQVRSGEIVGLAGIEGNGQREFLRSLPGLCSRRGTMQIDGLEVDLRNTTQAGAAGMAYIAADRHREGIFPGLSVKENIVARSLSGVSRGGVVSGGREDQLAGRLVRQFRIKTPTLDTDIESLSGGNQQKAVLAGAFATGPAVLLLDEPTQGVDVGARSEIYGLIRERAAGTGMGVVLLSSDAKELAGFCDRVLIFSRGQIVAELVGGEVTEEHITQTALQATAVREKRKDTRSPVSSWLAGDWAPAALVGTAVALLAVLAQSVNPMFLGPLSIAGMLTMATTLIFASLAQSLALLAGGIDLSVGPLMGFLVVVMSFFLVDGTSAVFQGVGWILLLVIPVIVGVVNWALCDLARMHPMIATLVTFMALQALSLILRPVPGGFISRGITAPLTLKLGPVPVVFLAAVILSVALGLLLSRSRAGVALRAVGSRPDTAAMNGLKPARVRLAAFVGASLIAMLGAVTLMAQIGSGDPAAGTSYTLSSITAAVIGGVSLLGGRGSFVGALLGALLIQVALSVTTFIGLDAAYQSFLLGGLTIVAVAGYSASRRKVSVEAHL
ncbi:ATP-binding cassette domain-containing protein [Arthrobacter zhaoguopingii]|uniref:ATP-binding cassette domain-containing protein n=1 Tax=Arthrobacter zhaoguopingii TaxID=2681491 RepID=UPI001357D831|nr:ATP-binding cassette domain-containing protein [Arthrobacter zhaoguopingii]